MLSILVPAPSIPSEEGVHQGTLFEPGSPSTWHISFAQNYSLTTMLFDHLFSLLKVAKLKIFEVVLSVDDWENMAFKQA